MLFAKIKQHYEAVVAVCCFLILFTNVGLPSTSFSVYQPYLVDLPGVGHSGWVDHRVGAHVRVASGHARGRTLL